MTLEEKINEELKQKEEETREEVKAEERMNFLVKVVNLIKKGNLSKEEAIEEFGYTEEEINNLL